MLEPKGGICDWMRNFKIAVDRSLAIGVTFVGETYISCDTKGNAER